MQLINPTKQQSDTFCIVNTLQYLTVSLAALTPSKGKDPNQPVMTAAGVEVCFEQVCEEERRG